MGTKFPTNFNQERVARVEAETTADAKALLEDAIHARGISGFDITACWEYTPQKVSGKVISVG